MLAGNALALCCGLVPSKISRNSHLHSFELITFQHFSLVAALLTIRALVNHAVGLNAEKAGLLGLLQVSLAQFVPSFLSQMTNTRACSFLRNRGNKPVELSSELLLCSVLDSMKKQAE